MRGGQLLRWPGCRRLNYRIGDRLSAGRLRDIGRLCDETGFEQKEHTG